MAEQTVNVESSTFYVVNAEVSIFNTVMSDQVNAEASTFYTFNAKTSSFYVMNAETIAASYIVNAQTNISHAVDTEANAPYKNAVYDEFEASCENATIGEVNKGISSAIMVLHSNSSLCDLLKTLDSRLEKEAEWNRFFEYQTLSSCVRIVSVSSEIFPTIDHILSEYLTLHMLSIERIEMAQCLYFDTILADLTMVGLDDEDENIEDRFIEDIYNLKQILLKSMISQVNQANIKEIWQIINKRPDNIQKRHFIVVMDPISYLCTCMSNISRSIIYQYYFQVMLVSTISGFHIRMVVSRWYYDNKKEATDQENMVFLNKDASQTQHNQVISLIPQPLTIPRSVAKTTQLAIENDNNEIVQWLKTFINRKRRQLTQADESESEESEKKNNLTVANPPITKCKGRPETKQYKAAIEKTEKTEKARHQQYTCQSCDKTVHNSVRCSKKRS
ncbi:15957_t:CDS:2 [Racocetra fulgida]|uniref:15956_t:CDS:1 n=1 Tax=Racocetra fulgida TaxID=60492 RepID=A0A9N8VF96_9GLOM|nr:15956_t:CDS:2 [Racocetra fulgida]CAG8451038.1 15957_t:CDS:2 [Racocetra fulgida]